VGVWQCVMGVVDFLLGVGLVWGGGGGNLTQRGYVYNIAGCVYTYDCCGWRVAQGVNLAPRGYIYIAVCVCIHMVGG